MKRIWTRPYRPSSDGKLFSEYMNSTPNNLFDRDILRYPTTGCIVAHNGQPLLFMPFQTTIMLESLAKKPDISNQEMAISLKETIGQVQFAAQQSGIGELYFLCKDESTMAFAEKNGFERLPWPIFRLKLKDLEQPDAEPTKDTSSRL